MKPANPQPKEVRDQLILDTVRMNIDRADMARRSGLPETANYLLRGAFPILLEILYRRFTDRQRNGASANSMLENLKCLGVFDEEMHLNLRLATAGLTEYGSGRDAELLVAACNVLYTRIKVDDRRKKRASESRVTLPKPEIESKQSRFQRWAQAAAVVLTFGGAS